MQQYVDSRVPQALAKGRRREGRDGFKAALGRSAVVAAVDLGASKVTCFIMKPDGHVAAITP